MLQGRENMVCDKMLGGYWNLPPWVHFLPAPSTWSLACPGLGDSPSPAIPISGAYLLVVITQKVSHAMAEKERGQSCHPSQRIPCLGTQLLWPLADESLKLPYPGGILRAWKACDDIFTGSHVHPSSTRHRLGTWSKLHNLFSFSVFSCIMGMNIIHATPRLVSVKCLGPCVMQLHTQSITVFLIVI